MYWAALSNILSGRVKRFKRQPHKLEILGFDSLGPHPITNIGVLIMSRLYEWLFSEKERKPIGFIPLFFMIILISTLVCIFILSVSRAIMWI